LAGIIGDGIDDVRGGDNAETVGRVVEIAGGGVNRRSAIVIVAEDDIAVVGREHRLTAA